MTGSVLVKTVRGVRRVSYAASILAAAVSTLIAIGLFAEVVAREGFGRSIPGIHEAVRTLLVAVVFLAVPYAEQANTHVRVTLLTGLLPTRLQAALRAVALGAALYIVVLMLQATFMRAQESYAMNEHVFSIVRFPIWPARWIIVVGLALLAVELVIKTCENLVVARTGAVEGTAVESALSRGVGTPGA